MIDKDKIAELSRLEAEATPGPWEAEWELSKDSFCQVAAFSEDGNRILQNAIKSFKPVEDAALIVAMRNALPELLKALEAARELADWCEFEVGADTGLTPGLETLREYLPPHGGGDAS